MRSLPEISPFSIPASHFSLLTSHFPPSHFHLLEAIHERAYDQKPSVRQDKQDEFKRQGNHDRRQHHHTH